jgi:hypothetical protein
MFTSSIKNWFKQVLQKMKPVVKMPEDQVKEEKQNPFYIPEKKLPRHFTLFHSQILAKQQRARRKLGKVQRKSRQINRAA